MLRPEKVALPAGYQLEGYQSILKALQATNDGGIIGVMSDAVLGWIKSRMDIHATWRMWCRRRPLDEGQVRHEHNSISSERSG